MKLYPALKSEIGSTNFNRRSGKIQFNNNDVYDLLGGDDTKYACCFLDRDERNVKTLYIKIEDEKTEFNSKLSSKSTNYPKHTSFCCSKIFQKMKVKKGTETVDPDTGSVGESGFALTGNIIEYNNEHYIKFDLINHIEL